jgi:hypothetical protein
MTLGGLMRERPREYEPLLAAAKVLRDSVRKLQIVDFGVKRRRGRPPATNRRMLAVAVAAVLSLNNVRVTTSRGGAYARVLNTVFKEAYGTAADDPFRLIKHGSHAVKGATLDELRRFARN